MHSGVDHRISAIATTQHGVIHRDQLRAAGLSDQSIARRVQRGLLHRIHRGVYAVGHIALGERGRWMAAVLACGVGAVLDLDAAARLHRLERLARRTRPVRIAVLVPRRHKGIAGIDVRFTRHLPSRHMTTVEGIPVVSVGRLLTNLANREPASVLCKLMNEAAYLGSLDLDAVRTALQDLRNTHGHAVLSEAVDLYEFGEGGTDSEFEEAGLQFVRELGARDPELNVTVRAGRTSYRADQVWRRERVILELDGPGHARPTHQRLDRSRRKALTDGGWTIVSLTPVDVRDPARRRAAGAVLVAALTRGDGLRNQTVARRPQRSAL